MITLKMEAKIKALIALNVVLLLAIFVASAWGSRSRTMMTDNLPNFALQDSAEVTQLVFGNNVFKKQYGKVWTINEKTQADALMMEQMLTILQQIDIKRTLTDKTKAEVKQKIDKEGITVKFFVGEKLQKSFKIIGVEKETFAQLADNELFAIHTPAHKAVLHEIMGLAETAWRNKTLLSTGWNSLQTLSLEYTQKPEQSFKITFDSLLYKEQNLIFYKVAGVSRIDSVLLFNYVQNLNSVRASRYIENEKIKDSLLQVKPFCIMQLADLSAKNSNTLRLYANSSLLFAFSEKNKEVALLDPRYFAGFLLRKKDFEKN
jgi:hypothetical protein